MDKTMDMAREVKATAYTNRHYPDRTTYTFGPEQLKAFEALVRADEREACAKTKVGKPRELKPVGRGTLLDEQQFCFDKGWREGVAAVRAAIRARGTYEKRHQGMGHQDQGSQFLSGPGRHSIHAENPRRGRA